MRRYLSPNLKQHFETAWQFVPYTLQRELRYHIRAVKSVPTIEGTRIKCADGTDFVVEGGPKSYGYCFHDRSGPTPRSVIILSEEYCTSEIDAVRTSLHELAHAQQDLDLDSRAAQLVEWRSEAYAWLHVAAWLVQGPVEYKHTVSIAHDAITEARIALIDRDGEIAKDALDRQEGKP